MNSVSVISGKDREIKISIIIPAYNVEQYICQSIESAAQQTMHDIEIICVDDCSTDGTVRLIEEQMAKDSRIKGIFFPERRSTLCARNAGIRAATGRYIMFCDADDYLAPNACELLYKKIEEEQVDILHFMADVKNYSDFPQKDIDACKQYVLPLKNKRLEKNEVFSACFVKEEYHFTLWNKIYRRDLCLETVKELGDRFLPKAQDLLFYFILSRRAKSYYGWHSPCLYTYCYGRGASFNANITLELFERHCTQSDIAKVMDEYAKNQGDWQILQKIVFNFARSWCSQCLGLFLQHFSVQETDSAVAIMRKYWSDEELAYAFSRRFWGSNKPFVKSCLPLLPISERHPGNKHCIAIFYHSLSNGGVERCISLLAPVLCKQGHRVIVVTEEKPAAEDYVLPAGVERETVAPPVGFNVENTLLRIRDWQRILSKYPVDTVIYEAWMYHMLPWELFYLRLRGMYCIIQTNSVASYPAITSLERWPQMLDTYQLGQAVVVLSESDRAFWSAYHDNVHFIFNPLDRGLLKVTRRKNNNKTVIWIGRLSWEKRPWLAVEAFVHVVKKIPDAKLLLVGGIDNGEDARDRCLKLIKEHNLADNVELCGYQTDVEPYWRRASICINTSVMEGYPMVLIEAKAHGIPVVMTSMPFLATAQPHTGVTGIPDMDVMEAGRVLVHLLEDEAAWRSESDAAYRDFERMVQYDFSGAWRCLLDGERITASIDRDSYRMAIRTMVQHHMLGIQEKNKQHADAIANLRQSYQTQPVKKEVREAVRPAVSYDKFIKKAYWGIDAMEKFGAEPGDIIVTENDAIWGTCVNGVPVCSPKALLEAIEEFVVVILRQDKVGQERVRKLGWQGKVILKDS